MRVTAAPTHVTAAPTHVTAVRIFVPTPSTPRPAAPTCVPLPLTSVTAAPRSVPGAFTVSATASRHGHRLPVREVAHDFDPFDPSNVQLQAMQRRAGFIYIERAVHCSRRRRGGFDRDVAARHRRPCGEHEAQLRVRARWKTAGWIGGAPGAPPQRGPTPPATKPPGP